MLYQSLNDVVFSDYVGFAVKAKILDGVYLECMTGTCICIEGIDRLADLQKN